MGDKTEYETEKQEIVLNDELRKLTFTELASMLHGLLFAYEKVIINLYGNDVRKLYPYIIEELSHVLHAGDNPVIDSGKNLEDNIDRILYFISNEEYLKDLSFKKTGEQEYEFRVGACSFAKSGVHEILKIKEGICPFALVIASCITELHQGGYVKVSQCEFDEEGSVTKMELVTGEEDISNEMEIQLSRMDDEILSVPSPNQPIDELDSGLIRELRKNGRQTNVELAKALNTSESTVRRRIDNLIARNIIRGFTALLNYGQTEGVLRAFITIRVKPSHMDTIIPKLTRMKETCSVYKSIGKHNLVCETMFSNRAKLQEFIDEVQYMDGVIEMEYSIASSAAKPCPWYGF
jgi:Lrp/AsnC family transcriptional regulator for asnA, asnC and gidA